MLNKIFFWIKINNIISDVNKEWLVKKELASNACMFIHIAVQTWVQKMGIQMQTILGQNHKFNLSLSQSKS